jgi:hypothetical protein
MALTRSLASLLPFSFPFHQDPFCILLTATIDAARRLASTMVRFVLSCLVLVLSRLVLVSALSRLYLSCLVSLVVSLFVLSCLVLSCRFFSCLVVSCLVSCLYLSCLIWSGLVWSCLVVFCPCLELSRLILSSCFCHRVQ